MNNLGRIAIFLEVAQQNSFAKAARALGLSGPAVSKQIGALEAELGVKLLNRTTRHVSLTDEGTLYFERARTAMEELRDAAEEIQDMKRAPKGPLRVSVPLSFGQTHLLPVLSGFAKKYPDVQMEVILDDHWADLMNEGFDVVIRIGAMTASGLVCRPLSRCPVYLVASPAYVQQHGAPQTPADLKDHRMISYTLHNGQGDGRYKDPQGRTVTVRTDSVFKANTAEMMLQAALDSIGIATLPIFSVDSYLRSGQLVHLLPAYTIQPPRTISALMLPNRYRTAKVRLFVDWLTEACKAMSWGECPSSP